MTVTYTIHNDDVTARERTCDTILTAGEVNQFLTVGATVAAHRLDPGTVTVLQDAADALMTDRFPNAAEKTYNEAFRGQYVRDPHKIDPRLALAPLAGAGIADTVRCLLGPRVVLRNSNLRCTQPGSGDSTVWHTDWRPHTTPAPLLPMPTIITVLIYLDETTPDTGPLYVMPGSHVTPGQPEPVDGHLDGERAILVEPGQVVFMNAATWHRGGPNNSADHARRLLTLQLAPVCMGEFNFEPVLPSPAFQEVLAAARARADEPLLELLGCGGIDPRTAHY